MGNECVHEQHEDGGALSGDVRGVKQSILQALRCTPANKRLVQTPPARSRFGILARHTGVGGGVSAFLPLRAREAQYKRGVRTLLE
jgi:hypothetical protein